jgi:predicted phosphodiesterase
MRLVVLKDIHGNLPAFEAALEDARRQGYDQMVLLGDVVNGLPDSAACWHLAKSLGVPILRGNHERYVAHYGTPRGSANWTSAQFAPIQWTVEQFSEAERSQMEQLPTLLRLEAWDDLLLVHACLQNDRSDVYAHTPEHELEDMFAEADEAWLLRGHNHAGSGVPTRQELQEAVDRFLNEF